MSAIMEHEIYWNSRNLSLGGQQTGLRLLHVFAVKATVEALPVPPDWYSLSSSDSDALRKSRGSTSRSAAYLVDYLESQSQIDSKPAIQITFVLPYCSGWIVRSDFLQLRLQALSRDYAITSFVEPLQQCQLNDYGHESTTFFELLHAAVGAISAPVDSFLYPRRLEEQLLQRLSYAWLSPEPIPRRAVALVRGRSSYKSGRMVYEAAKFLGVSLIIIDIDGHWLEPDSEFNLGLRKAFLATNVRHGPELVNRLVVAVQSSTIPIDGIFTLSDDFLVPVADAAERLGLPTSPSSAHQTAVDKFLSRSIQAAPEEFLTVSELSDYHQSVAQGVFRPHFPLIVKPRTRGWSSENVAKVRDEEELVKALNRVCSLYSSGAVIEPYYDGPEVDVDFVLSDGSVLYRQITDELPSPGDMANGNVNDFQETSMMVPSKLPPAEQEHIYDTMLRILLQLGFRTGVFHCEARITNSSVGFDLVDDLLEFVPKTVHPEGQVKCHLIEINARPPGFQSVATNIYTFGVDYFAARILAAVNDIQRLEKVSTPFSVPTMPSGAGCWSHLLFLPVLQGGLMTEKSTLAHVFARVPEMAAHIVWSVCMFEPGDMLPDPSDGAAIFATLLLSSNESRRHTMEVAAKIEVAFREYHDQSHAMPSL